MTRAVVVLAVLAGIVTSEGRSFAAPARPPVTVEEFVARCKSEPAFCKIRIMAAETLLEKNRKACPPGSLSKDAMAGRVQDMIGDVLEEDPDNFRGSPYRSR